MFDFTENYKIAREAAAEGMVLLKNENSVLPFKSGDRVGLIGDDSLNLIRGGGGSANVLSLYTKSIADGLDEKAAEGKVVFYKESVQIAKGKLAYSHDELSELSKHISKAIVVVKRYACEGTDREIEQGRKSVADQKETAVGEVHGSVADIKDSADKNGYYYPHKYELELLDSIEKSQIEEVVVVLNIASTVDLTFLNKYKKVKGILLAYLPGMEGGSAVCDVLCGDVNPSGKLTDTFALSYEDYPSAPYYNTYVDRSEYKEGIFVGYRYFETYARDRVLYPFGYGLSYTEFEMYNYTLDISDGIAYVGVDVKNIGRVCGKEVVQVYFSAPKGKLSKPYIQLCAYEKTALLKPGESRRVELCFKLEDMASFDDEGEYMGSYILEKGCYKIFAGNSVRNLCECGEYIACETYETQKLSMLVTEKEQLCDEYPAEYPDEGVDKGITLYDVKDGEHTVGEFVRQFTAEELIAISMGQHSDFAMGTAGIGNSEKYKIPNPQTADGPAGLRKSVPTTCFPCATLLAASFDKKLVFRVGKALGYEGISTGVDVLLAPGLNIHRNPLCGRGFEYYSEDPYVAGKTAAAMVEGIQSEGLCATIKHFFANNCELNRLNNNSIMSERCAREIYLKGFEIAVKEAKPAFVMSAYNFVNGKRSSSNKNVLTGILRGEWGFEGAVMTDWRCLSHLWEEIKAGNNIKMPFGYPEEEKLALEKYKDGVLSRYELEQSVIAVLNSVMKTNRFKTRNFGIVHKIAADVENKIDVTKTLGISTTRVSMGERDGHKHLGGLVKDQRRFPTFIYYRINVEKGGEYTLSCEVKTDCPQSALWVLEDDALVGKISCEAAKNKERWYTVAGEIPLSEGEHILKLIIVTDPNEKFEHRTEYYWDESDFALDSLALMRR